MQSKRRLSLFVAAFTIVFGFLTIAAPLFAASKENVLHSFNGTDGASPQASLIFDAAGNLYGTTPFGGSVSDCKQPGCGTVFQLTPGTNRKWTEKVLHRFKSNGKDGINPYGSLVSDPAGNLYGTTIIGGPGGLYGYGVVFQLTPRKNGTWTEKVLYTFCTVQNCTDGVSPYGGLILDAAGNLYGTTTGGGAAGPANGFGTVFELMPGAGGKWTERVLYSFDPLGNADGAYPQGSLIFDAAGNLYGTTLEGGNSCGYPYAGCGTVFELTPGANGTWTESVLYEFCNAQYCADGYFPNGGLALDVAGNLYGTTSEGGNSCYHDFSCGIVFQLTPGPNGAWTETVLYSFCTANNCRDGASPGPIFDAAGNLYGTTSGGGVGGYGTVFKLVPGAGGKWTERVLHSFNWKGKDGVAPLAGLIFDAAGNLYGTTWGGGGDRTGCDDNGCGTVFEITP